VLNLQLKPLENQTFVTKSGLYCRKARNFFPVFLSNNLIDVFAGKEHGFIYRRHLLSLSLSKTAQSVMMFISRTGNFSQPQRTETLIKTLIFLSG
jgi:hypothetical protein